MADRYDLDPEAFDFAMPRTSTDPKQAGEFVRGAKYAPFDLLGMFADIPAAAMSAVGVPIPEKPFLGSEYLIDKYADLVEAFGSSYDRPTGSTAETAGRLVGGAALDPALLAAGIGRTFARTTTKTRGSGIEKKGVGSAQDKEFIKTRKAYKLFEQDPETGTLYPLFVDAKTPVRVGEWQKATLPDTAFTAPNGKQYVPSKKWDGKAGTGDSIAIPDQATREMLIEKGFLPQGSTAKSIKAVALRPGWHSGEFPVASHIGPEEVVMGQKMKTRGPNQVWAEVEVPDDVDWQALANERASIVKSGARKGEINRAEAQITDELPLGGSYKYQQGQARDGNWIISGEMRVNRVLDDDEVRSINESAGMQDLPRLTELMKKSEAPSSDLGPSVASKEVLEGDIVGGKTKQYETLESKADQSLSEAERLARQEMMEQQGITDAFMEGKAGLNIDKTFEWVSRGDEGAYNADDFIDGVIDSFGAARGQGMDRGDALVTAVREQTASYNNIYGTNAFDETSILNDIENSVNEDFGFGEALSRYREGQANRQALESELSSARSQARQADMEAQRNRFRQSIGITDDMPEAEAARIMQEYANKQQAGISGVGIPDPTPTRPNLTLVKKAQGGKIDLRSGIGSTFKLYS